MGRIIKRIVILAGVFVAALGVYFITAQNAMDKSEAVYTVMEEPSLPVVYTSMFEGEENRLAAYRQEMRQTVSRESLTVLPEDRQLQVRVSPCSRQITAVQYEIRSMDLTRLVERTPVETWENSGEEVRMVLPVQNLLTKEKEYLLHLMI